MRIALVLCALVSYLPVSVQAQSSGNVTTPSATLSINTTVFLTTSSFTTTTVTRSGGRNVPITTVRPTVVNVTLTQTSTILSTPTASSTTTPTPAPIVLDTKLDPAFGVLGALLIITGLPSAFWGHKNRWSSFFLIGFYTLSLVCCVLILKFGVLAAVNPPNKTIRGMFVLACAVAGVAGGGITVFFWKTTKYFIGALGGFAFGLFIECFKDGGLINPVGFRWIMYMGCAVIGFVLCTIPKLHWHVLLVATAFAGASAFMLGVDCFTTAGLKEFYIWNLGFKALFPKFVNNGIKFPVTQAIQIELGLMGAVALMGGAVQLRVLAVLQRKLKEIAEEQKKRDEAAEAQATQRFAGVSKELEEWERDHPTLSKHGRQGSGYESTTPLIKDGEMSPMSTTTFGDVRSRYLSGVSNLDLGPRQDEEVKQVDRPVQSPGVLPTMDLGIGIKDDVPSSFLKVNDGINQDMEDLARKEALLSEIQAVRKSIDQLRSDSPPNDTKSRRLSLSSRRTLSQDLTTALALQSGHLRPPTQSGSRSRVQSMELDRLVQSSDAGTAIGRPSSAPLKDDSWNTYIQERKLLQPPSGVTAPIPTTPVGSTSKIAMPQAVTAALTQRKQRESMYELTARTASRSPQLRSSEDVPIAELAAKRIRPSSTGPATILPPLQTGSSNPQRPNIPRTLTKEELADRHRQKMREMQAPLTHAEKQQAELEAAKARWERSNDIEKSIVTKRQAEQAALYAKEDKKRKSQEGRPIWPRRGSVTLDEPVQGQHSRSLSSDKLATLGNIPRSSRRTSTMKVEDWQNYQHEAPERGPASNARRQSRSPVPFPDQPRRESTYDKRRADRSSALFRDPPN